MYYADFQWFKDVPEQILNVEALNAGHFIWPGPDLDLTAELVEYPESFSLIRH